VKPDRFRFTLDHNCLIDLDEGRPNAEFVREIVASARMEKHVICIPASAAAERRPDGSTADSFNVYKSRLARLGLDGAEILLPQMRVGMGYLGYGRRIWTGARGT
jgi:hypothetical protein